MPTRDRNRKQFDDNARIKEPPPMDTKQAAEALATDPKVLRRFLRADSRYSNAGAGGRYVFTDDMMPDMREHFAEWLGEKTTKPTMTRAVEAAATSGDVAAQRMPRHILGRKLYASERTKRDAISRARVDKLEAALKERGLHISQMRELTSR